MKVGVVGATGLVGETFLKLLEERQFPITELRPFASAASAGKPLHFKNLEIPLETLEDGCFEGLDLVFFSSGNEISEEWAPKAVEAGAFAIDNSSAFRLSPNVPLVVPEVNPDQIPSQDNPSIIANPNCSTIQMVVALAPLAKFDITDIKVSTYQSASGAGREALAELKNQYLQILNKQEPTHEVFQAPLAGNCIPQIGSIEEDGFSSEEKKMIFETRKILNRPDLGVSAFTVRVPTMIGHAESIWVTLDKEASKTEINEALSNAPGVQLDQADYPLVDTCADTNPVYVGRVHQDLSNPKTWLLWVVADNVRKGAALNGLQIAEAIFDISPSA